MLDGLEVVIVTLYAFALIGLLARIALLGTGIYWLVTHVHFS